MKHDLFKLQTLFPLHYFDSHLNYISFSSISGKPDGDAAYDHPQRKYYETSAGQIELEQFRSCGYFNIRKGLYLNEAKKNRKAANDGRNYMKQQMIHDLVDFMPSNSDVIPSSMLSKLMTDLVKSMDGRKFVNEEGKVTSMKMSKGYEITATHKDEELKSVDHYLLDEDAVKLAWRIWDEEILEGQFFVVEGLLEQWFDLSYRSRDDVFELFKKVCKEEFDADVDEGMGYMMHKKMLHNTTYEHYESP